MQIGTFFWRGGPEKYEWIGAATGEVFKKNLWKQGLYHRRGFFTLSGFAQVVDGVLYVQATLQSPTATLGRFESSGNPDMPFEVWAPVEKQLNGRMGSLGLRPLVSLP